MTIRPAVEADVPLIIDLAQRIWRACYPEIISPEQIEFMLGWMYSEDEIRRQIAAGVPWKIAELDGRPIGYLSYHREEDGRVKISKLYVLPEHQRRGHGQEMLAHIFEQARMLGAPAVWLQVNKRNEGAMWPAIVLLGGWKGGCAGIGSSAVDTPFYCWRDDTKGNNSTAGGRG